MPRARPPSSPAEALARAAIEGLSDAWRKLPKELHDDVLRRPVTEAMRRAVLRALVRAQAQRVSGIEGTSQLRLFRVDDPLESAVAKRLAASAGEAGMDSALSQRWGEHGFDARTALSQLGRVYEILLGFDLDASSGFVPGRARKQSGSYYTPDEIARVVVSRGLEQSNATARGSALPAICDPAMGAGAFLLAAADWIVTHLCDDRQRVVAECLYGVDLSPTAVALSEALLWLWSGAPASFPGLDNQLQVGDALSGPALSPTALFDGTEGFSWLQAFPELRNRHGFDAVVGNPPWVAFAGRATQPLEPGVRSAYRNRFESFAGYPTLHGLFIERAAQLAPKGVVALLVPSPVADLAGYRATRACLGRSHTPIEPLLEFGQDAFEAVVQPCFALIAVPRQQLLVTDEAGNPWRLQERQRLHTLAEAVEPPGILRELSARPCWPRELFGELGFQSNRRVTERLLLRAAEPREPFTTPLLEGRNVKEFSVGPVGLFLDARRESLSLAGASLRPLEYYGRVSFVVRQTAKTTIAARHNGLPFRNSLLAGFDHEQFDADFVVGLLNSTLYRSLHLAGQRDARQAAFPQVKVAHLRSLPAPPEHAQRRARVRALSRQASQSELGSEFGQALDAAVFDLFEVDAAARAAIEAFLQTRAPELARQGSAGSSS